jgi:hypothetical protein
LRTRMPPRISVNILTRLSVRGATMRRIIASLRHKIPWTGERTTRREIPTRAGHL